MFEFLTQRRIHSEANILLFTAILSFLGIFIAGYLVYDHYLPGSLACPEGEWIDCGEVTHGEYNNIFGIPLAHLGLIGIVLIFLFAVLRLKHWNRDYTENFFVFVLILSFLGALLTWYLTYLELFVIYKICIYCFTEFILVTIIFGACLYGFVKGE
jgi:uncharacterized membrane protein